MSPNDAIVSSNNVLAKIFPPTKLGGVALTSLAVGVIAAVGAVLGVYFGIGIIGVSLMGGGAGILIGLGITLLIVNAVKYHRPKKSYSPPQSSSSQDSKAVDAPQPPKAKSHSKSSASSSSSSSQSGSSSIGVESSASDSSQSSFSLSELDLKKQKMIFYKALNSKDQSKKEKIHLVELSLTALLLHDSPKGIATCNTLIETLIQDESFNLEEKKGILVELKGYVEVASQKGEKEYLTNHKSKLAAEIELINQKQMKESEEGSESEEEKSSEDRVKAEAKRQQALEEKRSLIKNIKEILKSESIDSALKKIAEHIKGCYFPHDEKVLQEVADILVFERYEDYISYLNEESTTFESINKSINGPILHNFIYIILEHYKNSRTSQIGVITEILDTLLDKKMGTAHEIFQCKNFFESILNSLLRKAGKETFSLASFQEILNSCIKKIKGQIKKDPKTEEEKYDKQYKNELLWKTFNPVSETLAEKLNDEIQKLERKEKKLLLKKKGQEKKRRVRARRG